MDQTNDLTLWPILRRLSNDFLSILDRFFIFNNGESVLLFCKDGKVYGFGQNPYGMLGVPHDDFRQKYLGLLRFHCNYSSSCSLLDKPRELIKLRFINVIALSKGDKHMMALTETGDLYGWGANHSGQLGIGWYRSYSSEPTLILHDVQKVCCGPKHTAALIFDGTILLWGKFPGCQHNFTPERLIRAPTDMIDLISTKFLTIGYNNHFDDDDKSAFYVWGDLKHFGLSGSSTVRLTYKRCDYDEIFKIIPISSNKILVLTQEGRVSIICIQNERVRSIRNPFRVMNFINFCIDIPEDPNVVIMRDCDGYCFVWDERRPSGEHLFSTHITSLADTACLYSSSFTPQLTKFPQELISKDISKNSMNSKILELQYNDPRLSDLIFRFKHYQFKPIYVHRSVLIAHSQYFHQTFSKTTTTATNNKPQTVTVEDNSYISMFYYLRYVYTKQISLHQFDDCMLSEIYDLASKYFDQELMDKITDHLYPTQLSPTL